jgi:hypothetical protein
MGIPPSPVNKKKNRKSWKEICRNHLNYDPDQSPLYKKGTMIEIERFTSQRGTPLKSRLKPNAQ